MPRLRRFLRDLWEKLTPEEPSFAYLVTFFVISALLFAAVIIIGRL